VGALAHSVVVGDGGLIEGPNNEFCAKIPIGDQRITHNRMALSMVGPTRGWSMFLTANVVA